MIYPKLVRNPQQSVTVRLNGTLNEDGEVSIAATVNAKAYVQLKTTSKLTADRQLISLAGLALCDGDIAPDLPDITGGELDFNGHTYTIYSGTRNYNPDGTVNYTSLELVR